MHRTPSNLRRNMGVCTAEGMLSMPLVYLLAPGNLFLTALLTQIYGFGEGEFSWVAALPFLGNVLQAVLMAWLSHRFSTRTLTLAGAWINLAVWLGFTLAMPWIPRNDPRAALPVLMVVFSVSAVFFSISAVAWQAWLVEWLPERLRGRYFGRRNFCVNLVLTIILVSGAEVLRAAGTSLTGYQILFGGVALLRIWGLFYMHRQHSPPPRAGTHQDVPLREALAALLAQRPLLWFLVFNMAIGFLMNTTNPFIAIFMLEHLDYTVGEVTWLVVIATAIGALSVSILGRWADRWGHRNVLVFCFVGWELSNLVWPFMRPGPLLAVMPLVWYVGGFCAAGFILCQLSLLLRLAPPQGKAMAVSVNTAATSVAAALGILLAGRYFDWGNRNGADPIAVYHGLFWAKSALMFVSLLLIRAVPEPKQVRVAYLAGALRTWRLTAGAQFAQVFNLLGGPPRR